MKKSIVIFGIFTSLCGSYQLWSQEEQQLAKVVVNDDLGNVSDEFQEYFFEALKQKGIENYEKAIVALEKCEQLQPQNPVVFFEIAKNHKALENYSLAEENFRKAVNLEPQREAILAEWYDMYMLTSSYEEAISVVKKLVPLENSYNEDLANLYMLSGRYEKALELLDELDKKLGSSSYREKMRRQIYAITNNTTAQINNLEKEISADPENEQNYLNLIYVYSQEGNDEEAFKIAQELLEANPGSTLVHLALYKFHLDRGETEAAVNSMKMVFHSEEIDPDSKYKVLNDFLLFVGDNPEYENDLMEMTQLLSNAEERPELYQELGQYYLRNGSKEEALEYFEKALKQNPDNFELTKSTLLLQIDFNKFEAAAAVSEEALEIFPAQPVLYLLRGVALNALKQYKEAEEILTFGLDFLIDDKKVESDFYAQLALANAGLDNEEKAAEFSRKAELTLKEIN
ncbi:tetratricopeptide repeat protein [Zunongwangia sp. F363]|uniref:Tetratricopeptide repeat protein n=1 Tax=Autumnicola tepida TaxID=3075595 RepID=A0ABU3C743_9FLAO|nr:tetratricopeptide repeat protein [Zunongwangia sp. F363]MDT0642137.1 tetratricopeptide repeat protein [Zunongwangia sp. F363]